LWRQFELRVRVQVGALASWRDILIGLGFFGTLRRQAAKEGSGKR